jgi:hypothetical protein
MNLALAVPTSINGIAKQTKAANHSNLLPCFIMDSLFLALQGRSGKALNQEYVFPFSTPPNNVCHEITQRGYTWASNLRATGKMRGKLTAYVEILFQFNWIAVVGRRPANRRPPSEEA